jgi:subfamily B ATP-binding cassette protein MsbA
VIRNMLPLLRPYWKRQVEALVYMLFETACGIALPLATGKIIDGVVSGVGLDTLLISMLSLLAIQLGGAIVGMRRAYVTRYINDGVRNEFEARLFAHLQRLSHEFYARSRIGDIMARLSGDLDLVEVALAQLTGVGGVLILRSIAAAVVIVALQPMLGSALLLAIPLIGASYYVLRSRLQAASLHYQRLAGEVSATAQENLAAHAVVKAFGLEQNAINRYTIRLHERLVVGLKLAVLGSVFETSMALATMLSQMLVLGFGGYFVLTGQLTIGALVAFIGLLPGLLQPIAMLSSISQVVQRASGALIRVTEVLHEPVTIRDAPTAVPLESVQHDIHLDGVTFGYVTGTDVLRDIRLRIRAGTHVSIVGPSGSGKSTLVSLLVRFWEPDAGRILFDTHDIRDLTLASLRGQIGLVSQETLIFDATLRENIAVGRPGASDAEIEAAADAAQLRPYVASLPDGYDTPVGEHGARMSGGQRQRVALARALLRNPRMLILDEATSALDASTERAIVDALAMLGRGRTVISVTHRLSLAATADHIVVLDRGHIVERGTHTELVSAGGVYQRLYDEQQSGYGRAATKHYHPDHAYPDLRRTSLATVLATS